MILPSTLFFSPEILVRKSLSGNLCPESLVRRNWSMARITSFLRVPHMVIFSPWKSAPVCHAVHPERTLSTSGYFQALIFIFKSFDFAKGAASRGFLLLLTCIYSFSEGFPGFCLGAPVVHPPCILWSLPRDLKIYLVADFNQ